MQPAERSEIVQNLLKQNAFSRSSLVLLAFGPPPSDVSRPMQQEKLLTKRKNTFQDTWPQRIQERQNQLFSPPSCPAMSLIVDVKSHIDKDDDEGDFMQHEDDPACPMTRVYFTPISTANENLVKTTVRNVSQDAITLTPTYYDIKSGTKIYYQEEGDSFQLKVGEEREMTHPVTIAEDECETGWIFRTDDGALVLRVRIMKGGLRCHPHDMSNRVFSGESRYDCLQRSLLSMINDPDLVVNGVDMSLLFFPTYAKTKSFCPRTATRSAKRSGASRATPCITEQQPEPFCAFEQSFQTEGVWAFIPVKDHHGNALSGEQTPVKLVPTKDLDFGFDVHANSTYCRTSWFSITPETELNPKLHYELGVNVENQKNPLLGTKIYSFVLLNGMEQALEWMQFGDEYFSKMPKWFQFRQNYGTVTCGGTKYDTMGMWMPRFKSDRYQNFESNRNIRFHAQSTVIDASQDDQHVAKSVGDVAAVAGSRALLVYDYENIEKLAIQKGLIVACVIGTGNLAPSRAHCVDECPICFDKPGKFKLLTNCGHLVCESCLLELQRTKPICALCRVPFLTAISDASIEVDGLVKSMRLENGD